MWQLVGGVHPTHAFVLAKRSQIGSSAKASERSPIERRERENGSERIDDHASTTPTTEPPYGAQIFRVARFFGRRFPGDSSDMELHPPPDS